MSRCGIAAKGSSGGFRHGRVARCGGGCWEVGLSLTLLVAAGFIDEKFCGAAGCEARLATRSYFRGATSVASGTVQDGGPSDGILPAAVAAAEGAAGRGGSDRNEYAAPYGGIPSDIEVPGKTQAEKWKAMFQLVSEGYFPVLKIQFVDGRGFTEAEVNGARKLGGSEPDVCKTNIWEMRIQSGGR